MKSGQRTEKTERRLDLLERIVDSLPDGVLAIDREGKVVLWNRGVEEMTGVRKEEVLGKGEYAYAVPFYGERRPILVNILLGNGKEWESGYEKVERKGQILVGEGFAPYAYGGRGLHFWTVAAPIYDEAGNLLRAVQCIRDISEHKQMEDELRHWSTHDALTGLYNRAFFEEELRRLEKGRSFPVSLILCDLDGLKVVNDTLGHGRGDELLRRAARVIARCVSVSDLVARVGGDEFAMVLPQTDRATAEEVARRITQAVEEDNAGCPELPLSISVGTATAEDPGRPLVEAYKEADDAMNRDKLAMEAEPRGARKKADQLAFLYDFSQTVSGSLEVSEVAQRALEAALKVTGATSGSVVMLSEETPAALAAETAATLEPGDEFRIVPTGEVVAAVEQEGRAVHFDSRPGAGTAAERRPAVAVPLTVGGKVTGVLTVAGRPEGVPFSEDEAAFLTTMGTGLGLALENARLYVSLRQYYLSALQALAAALEAKDTYTRGHSMRVARLTQACARVLGLSDEEQEQLYLAALLHDIGKISVPESILLKPGPLEPAEWEEVKSHPVAGGRIVEPARFPPQVVAAIRHHHEDYGGGGYPDGLTGEKIPLLARIISVADAYDAMTSDRPYRRACTAEEAIEELRRGAGRQFDPRVVEAFLQIPAPEMVNNGRGGGGADYPTFPNFVQIGSLTSEPRPYPCRRKADRGRKNEQFRRKSCFYMVSGGSPPGSLPSKSNIIASYGIEGKT